MSNLRNKHLKTFIKITLLSTISGYLLVNYLGYSFTHDRLILFIMLFSFFYMHFFINVNTLYSYMLRKRYIIGILLLMFFVLNGYHLSSLNLFDTHIQEKSFVEFSEPIIGLNRAIRSDEWLVMTPIQLSQISENVKLSEISPIFMGGSSYVNFWPLLPHFGLSILSNIFLIGYLFLPVDQAISFFWFGRLFFMFFVSFELFRILINNDKYSLLGTVLVTFSSANLWWSFMPLIIFGEATILTTYYLITSASHRRKLILSVLLGISSSSYLMVLYPAWQIPFGYFYFILFYWVLYSNRSLLRTVQLRYFLVTILVLLVIVVPSMDDSMGIIKKMMESTYPGARNNIGGFDWEYLFLYFPSLLYPYKDVGNPSLYGSFMSLFPVPFVMAIFYSLRNVIRKRKDLFLILISAVLFLLVYWNFFPLSSNLSKLSLMYMSVPVRSQLAVGYISIHLMVYILSKYESENSVTKYELVLALLISVLISAIGLKYGLTIISFEYLNFWLKFGIFIMSSSLITLLFLNKKTLNGYFSIIMMLVVLISGLSIHPLNKGVNVLYDKPLAKKVREIVSENPNANFITLNSLVSANYILVNGAKVLNATNIYPNIDLWEKLDLNHTFLDIYNRYAHVVVNISNQATKFELRRVDYFYVNINYNDLYLIDVDYIILNNGEQIVSSNDVLFSKIYSEEGFEVYSVEYNKQN